MQFYNVICCFLWHLPYFYSIYEYKFNILVFLIMAPLRKLVLALRATIRDNTVNVLPYSAYKTDILHAQVASN